MKKKISESIQAKTFLSMLALLLACCIIIYAMVMVFLPKNYQTELESQATSDFYKLMETLERSGWEVGSEEVLAFSMKNNAMVRIADADGNKVFSVNYADPENWEEADKTMSCSATYQEGQQTYQVSADISLAAVSQSYEILLKLIPLIAVVILLISVLAALVCSRYFSKPLIHMEAILTLEMDRPIDVNKHCILPQGYEVETKDGNVYMFDFLTSYGFRDRENPAVIQFELYSPDYESFPDTHKLRKEIQNIVRIRDCCLDIEDIEI